MKALSVMSLKQSVLGRFSLRGIKFLFILVAVGFLIQLTGVSFITHIITTVSTVIHSSNPLSQVTSLFSSIPGASIIKYAVFYTIFYFND